MNKIREIIIEPNSVVTGSTFRLKIKAIKYLSYEEIKNKKYIFFKDYKYKDLKGV